jgi:hypothetical protein
LRGGSRFGVWVSDGGGDVLGGFRQVASDSAEFLNDSAKLGLYSANFNNYSAKTRMISAKLLFSYLFLEYSDLDFFDFQGIALLIVRAASAKLRSDSAEFLNDSAKLGLIPPTPTFFPPKLG